MKTQPTPPMLVSRRVPRRQAGPARHPRRGFALVIVLMILAITTILVVAFALSMRTERIVAANMVSGQRADMMAQTALNHAISLLATNIPDPGDPTIETPVGEAKNWYVNPGRLTVVDSFDATPDLVVDLHTGAAANADSSIAVNLNAQSMTTQEFPITGADHPMWVNWVNVLEDPSAAPSIANKITGRYAFWVDDENAKINFNTARGKPVEIQEQMVLPKDWDDTDGTTPRDLRPYLAPRFTFGGSSYSTNSPAAVNLDALDGLELNTLEMEKLDSQVKSSGFFDSPEAIKSFVVNDPEDFYERHKFNLTAFSRSPEFNVFGKSRIFMMDRPADLSSGALYQHSSHPQQPMQFWGRYSGVGSNTTADKNKMRIIREALNLPLAQYLERTDWPGFGGKKFRWTNDADDPNSLIGMEESDQIAINIASMGFWGTTNTTAQPKDVTNAYSRWAAYTGAYALSGANNYLWKGPLSGRPMMPNSLGPQVTEVACTVIPELTSATGTGWRLRFQFNFEFYIPPGYAWEEKEDPDNPGVFKKYYYNNNSTPPKSTGGGNYKMSLNMTYASVEVTENATTRLNSKSYGTDLPYYMPLDGFAVKTPTAYYVSKTGLEPAVIGSPNQAQVFSGTAKVKAKLRFSVDRGLEIAPIYIPEEEMASADAELRPPSGKNQESLLEFELDIPSPPFPTEGYTKSLEISDPRLFAKKRAWIPHDDGEGGESDTLGFDNDLWEVVGKEYTKSARSEFAVWEVNTNSFRSNAIGMFGLIPTGMQRSLPWETLKFHAYDQEDGEMPDWLIMDLLAPNFGGEASVRNSSAGKINLNSKIYPESTPAFQPPSRTAPLEALFRFVPNGDLMVQNMIAYQENGGSFDYIGRITEVPGVADDTLAAEGDDVAEFEKEMIIRNMAGLFTTQSNTFGVWGAAQSIKKRMSNTDYAQFQTGDLITGERRFYAVVERYVAPGADGVPGNAEVDEGGEYVKNSPDQTPGNGPPMPWKADAVWASIDGPHSPEPVNEVMGERPFETSVLATAHNPLAAIMKYRIIYFKYVD